MGASWTRRSVLSVLPASLTAANRGQIYPAERARFADGATENEVLRLTDPAHNSFLPPPHQKCSSSRGAFVIYSSDRTGSVQAYRLDFRSGESRLLTEAAGLRPESVSLTGDEKSVCYLDGRTLKVLPLSGGRERDVLPETASHAISEDGQIAVSVSGERLRVAGLAKDGVREAAKLSRDAANPVLRPKRAGVLYRVGPEIWLASLDGQENRKLKTAPANGIAQWTPDGRTILYLSAHELREHTPDSNTDALVAKTSQFASFHRNSDASVFVGASRSLAGPYVLLLLRVSRREMAICEHRASDPSRVWPSFSPSSQRIYFQSDRSGKWTLYSMAVERLVEKTET
jgi:oligogalacturonide lyase